jgi:GntR family transcriptional regulator
VKKVSNFQVRPLYLQVRDALVDRIKKGEFPSGGVLPSEIDLHTQLAVSLGTLRKALGVLEAENLIVREPGRGTFVGSHQARKSVDRFNPIRAADGSPIIGEVKTGKVKVGPAKEQERLALSLDEGDQVARFHRIRFLGRRPFAYECVCLPDRCFPGLALRSQPANELEELAQAWGLLVARAEAKVRAMPAPPSAATALSLRPSVIVLSMERLAFDTDDQPIEMMTAYLNLADGFCSLEMR